MPRLDSPKVHQPQLIAALVAAALILASAPVVAAIAIPEVPLTTNQVTTPLNMLVVGRDHTLFYEAYNDASDIDGDGTVDIRFKPGITYYGLFDSTLCYSHSGGNAITGKFTPGAAAGAKSICSDASYQWSGNWLNYATTSRIDALRKVFYGGYRDVDTDTETVLRRAYIPQDAHSWAKEYTSVAIDGYDIADYTPLALPTAASRRHFFGNLTATAGVNCATITNCSDLPPLLRVVENSDRRVWAWASTERPVLRPADHGGTARTDYTVRVQVCTASFAKGCKAYPNSPKTQESLKPVGLLQEYGENDAMLFGLLSGSYNKNMSGGVLRKVMSSFKNEIDANTGQFTANATIVGSLNSLRIRDFNNGVTDNSYRPGWQAAWVTTRPMNPGEFPDWGNPTGEMMYEALRYLAGKASATPDFAATGSYDGHIGLPVATWDDPYDANSAAKAKWCARANALVVSGINPSFDSDQVPGCDSNFGTFSGDLSGLKAADLGQTIADSETGIKGSRFIGQSGGTYDGAPTAKTVTSLGNIRGLAPEEPTKQGSYYSASVAYYGKSTDLRSALTGSQTVDTYAVVLSSPLPRIETPTTSSNTITLVPFAKSTDALSISNTKGHFQPTNQIVDFYVDTIANSSGASGSDYNAAVNGGRYYAKFRINFEDVEQGADHDMDAIVVYEIAAEANGSLRVRLTPEYQAGSIKHSIGYVISGTTKDGVYLVVQDENADRYYYLNVPAAMDPGGCDVTTPPAACNKLPYIGGPTTPTNLNYSERLFTAGDSTATLLKDPLWYAAKWGGFVDHNKNDRPDLPGEWDADKDGVPDTYFLVQNPLKLKDQLKKSFDTILARSASSGSITSNGQQITNDSQIFHTSFNSATWDGEIGAYPITAAGVGGTPTWKASDKLPSSAARAVFTRNDDTAVGVEFKTLADLGAAQQTALGSQAVLDYLRGDQSQEIQAGGAFRNRNELLGDIVHSAPYYVKDSDTVYVGGNDGFLHAFNAQTGVELFAYAPSQVFVKLRRLSDPSYAHTFFVDGDVAVSTWDQTLNQNWLVGALGRGAQGLFGLHVTNPASFSAADVAWEIEPTGDFADLGYVLGRPQIAKMNNGTLVAIFGNGYNSTNGHAVLYIVNLKTGALIRKIDTGVGGDNGLATPGLVDVDGDKDIDIVYAGDLKGNVWKFNVASSDPANWNVALSGSPLFVARDPGGVAQPITAKITAGLNTVNNDPNYGKMFIFFGTGSYISASDPADKQVQTWYGVIDDNATAVASRAELVARSIETSGTIANTPVRAFSAGTQNDMAGKRGWYVDLKDPTARGERIVTASLLVYAINPVLIASSIVPDPDPCVPGGTGYVNAISPFTGTRLSAVFFDVNYDKKFNSDDSLPGDKTVGSVFLDVGMPGEPVIVGNLLVVGGSSGAIKEIAVNLGSKFIGRASWREILN